MAALLATAVRATVPRMGRRARNRAGAEGAPARRPKPARQATSTGIDPARKIIGAYVGAAALLGLLTLVGIASLGGLFGPILVFLAVLGLALALQRTIARRIEGLELTEQDRLMRMLATGVLATAVVLALISAIVQIVVNA